MLRPISTTSVGAGLGQGVLHGGVEVLPFGEAVLMDTAWVLGLAFVVAVGDEKGWDAEVVQDRQRGQTVCGLASKTMYKDRPCVVVVRSKRQASCLPKGVSYLISSYSMPKAR